MDQNVQSLRHKSKHKLITDDSLGRGQEERMITSQHHHKLSS